MFFLYILSVYCPPLIDGVSKLPCRARGVHETRNSNYIKKVRNIFYKKSTLSS